MDLDSDRSTDVSVRGEKGSPEDRRIDIDEWWRRVAVFDREGINVTLVLDPLPEDPDLYLPTPVGWWVNDENHAEGGYWYEKSPVLLMIRTRFRRGALTFTDRRRRRDETPYHISLCFTNEIHRFNLFDQSDGIERGKAIYNRLRARYDGQRVHIPGKMHSGAFELKGRGGLASDPELQAMHACGKYHDRSVHVSM
jgi:hypothetical protein